MRPPERMEEVEHRHSHMDSIARLHMELTPVRRAMPADSAKARALVATIRRSLARFADTSAAIAEGYQPFLPGVPHRIHHYTKWSNGLKEAFRFDPAQPTSLLYVRGEDGRLVLHGVMYTAPKRVSAGRLDARIPLSFAQWHRHVDWCLPRRGDQERWAERQGGRPVFGPESPIATKEACRAVGGRFVKNAFGWMVHVNAFGPPTGVWEH